MLGWTLVDADPTQGRAFRRPLDATEVGFLWDGLFNGSLDILQHFRLRLPNGSQDTHLFSEINITRAWLSTKRRFPLAGATVQGATGPLPLNTVTNATAEGCNDCATTGDNNTGFASAPHFVVREHELSVLRQREIIFGEVANAEEAQKRATAMLNGPRPLSEDLLVQLYVFRETDPDSKDALHLITLMAHCITDAIANITFMRSFLDTLSRGGEPDLEFPQAPLEERLAMVIPSTDLEPAHLRSLSPARRRWRRAIAAVIFQLRMSKRQGGHTLPSRITRSTSQLAARTGHVSTTLTHEQSAAVIANCRLHGITFGNAYLALAQVAMTRVLYRRYLRGEISQQEWEYRKRQPHISGVPLNLRSYLDKTWIGNGGGGEFTLSLSFFYYQLPFMTLCEHDPKRILADGAPPFSELLTFERFLHRTGLVKKQATTYLKHPLFFEIVRAVSLARLERTRLGALKWMKRPNASRGSIGAQEGSDDDVLAVTDMPVVWAHGGSSLGNVDQILPSEYPLPPSHPLSPHSSVIHPIKAGYVGSPSQSQSSSQSPSPLPSPTSDATPTITMDYTMLYLHMHPAELYLGAASLRGQLGMYVLYDGNVFEDDVVREWLDEMRGAVLWYLGQTHQSRPREERVRGNHGQLGRAADHSYTR